MRYMKCTLIKEIAIGFDELSNEIFDTEKIDIKEARVTEWTADDITIYGRSITSSSRKVLIKPILGTLEGVSRIIIKGNEYDISRKIDLGRWILFIVKGYRL